MLTVVEHDPFQHLMQPFGVKTAIFGIEIIQKQDVPRHVIEPKRRMVDILFFSYTHKANRAQLA